MIHFRGLVGLGSFIPSSKLANVPDGEMKYVLFTIYILAPTDDVTASYSAPTASMAMHTPTPDPMQVANTAIRHSGGQPTR